ncbi:Spy/CpxP family protein refolding chaperone [Shewanella gelidii]|uniref:Periplasmic heavy metal sensor n=1 Tax=Shewanella gelidii TaxID=1642821 RepID=A0A917NAS9_9GAMM|nr:periplasmic heavy metal sensor [Shewanella gelidii]MCL1098473.1 Spy/CpxP family protein refolding chaperone [Shewanella gelidii]GGI82502.1 hypothetical protein GCM10009332_19630 [Shewanella gelidii]
MKTNNTLKLGALALALLSISAVTVAGGRGDCHHGKQMDRRGKAPMMKMLSRLDLSEAQRTEIKGLVKSHHEQMKQSRPDEATRTAQRSAMLEAITAETFNEQQVQQLLDSKQQQRQQMKLEKLKLQNAVYKVLTPEQQQEFKEKFMTQKAGKRGHGRFH